MRRSGLVAAVAVGAMVVGGGWFFGVRHHGGPLGDDALGNKLCLPVGESEAVTVGNLRLENTGEAPVRITDVSLIGADGGRSAR
jgi:hypothetical protein